MSIRTPRRGARLRLQIGVFGCLVLSAGSAFAQAHPSAVAPDEIRKIQKLAPRTGPPGTLVELYSENLPLQARVVVGVGAIGTGFEELADAEQAEFGEVSATVHVPASATWDRPLVFIIFNGNFSPTGLSDPFHVTNDDGHIYRVGEITSEGPGCVSMKDADGYAYTLTGDIEGLRPGDPVAVEGTFSAESRCAGGETIDVLKRSVPKPDAAAAPGR